MRRFTIGFFVLTFVFFVGMFFSIKTEAAGITRYVSTNGSDSGSCTSQSSPCRTIKYGLSQMSGGDTLILANGTYTGEFDMDIPNGSSGSYTTVKAETDFGATIDGRGGPQYQSIFDFYQKSYIVVRGINFQGPALSLGGANHIKFIRNSFANNGYTNVASGPGTDYMLFEENFAYGESRYQFQAYQSDHNVFRRNVGRTDYYSGSLPVAAFVNYDSVNTVWENNITLDSNTSCCTGPYGYYGGAFFSVDKADYADDTSQVFYGNIVLNYQVIAHFEEGVSGTRIIKDNIYWDTKGGYQGAQGYGTVKASWPLVSNITSGDTSGTYDGPNGGCSGGTGFCISENLSNIVKNSIFANNHSYGIADYINGSHNAFSGNGSNYGGYQKVPSPGSGDITNQNIVGNILKYLPRGAEPGTALATGGESGGRIGAQVMWKVGLDGTLWGEPGYDVVRSPENGYGRPEDRLWPWPNEAIIKSGMASYSGPGLPGVRGFTKPGNGLYGGPVTLTSYIWEYLGYPMPSYDQMYSNLAINPPTVTPTPTQCVPPSVASGCTATLINQSTCQYTIACPTPTSSPTPTPTPTLVVQTQSGDKFYIGQRVQTLANLNVRSTPSTSGSILGTQPISYAGTVVAGPTVANGYTWWNINYDSGADGWSVQDFLNVYNAQGPVPLSQIPPPSNLFLNCPAPGNKLTVSWSMPSGYNLAYIRANVGSNNNTFPSLIQVPENIQYTGSPFSFSTTPGQTYYVWLNTQDAITGNYSLLPADGNVTCQSGGVAVPTPIPTPTLAGTPQGPAGYTYCADEYGTCSFSGTTLVAYGLNGKFNYKVFTNGISCDNSNFGDPFPGVDKACFYYKSTPTPVPTPTPTVVSTPVPTVVPTPTGVKFIIGQKVKTTANLNVRDLPSTSGTILGAQPVSSQGIVMSGPVSAGGYNWWYVIYDTGRAGWSVENYLESVVSNPTPTPTLNPTPLPTPTPTPTPTSTVVSTPTPTPTLAGTPQGPAGYTYCAKEYGICSFSGTTLVAYGLNGTYSYKVFTNGVSCDNDNFGDPFPGVDKACFYYKSTPTPIPTPTPTVVSTPIPTPTLAGTPQGPAGYTYCANEYGYCSFGGSTVVAYGLNGKFNYKVLTNGASCDNSNFGDPFPGVDKACFYYKSTPTPVPVVTTAPTPTPVPTSVGTPGTSTKFKVGDRIQTSSTINVRSSAGITSTILGTQQYGSLGVVTAGSISQDGFNWWNINFDTGADGWSTEDYMFISFFPTPTPTAVPQPTPTTSGNTSTTLFPASSWFYRDVSNYPLDAENTLVTTALNGVNWGFGALRIDFSIDVLKADASTPLRTFNKKNGEFYSPDCDYTPIPVPSGGNVEGENGYQCTQDGDCHLIVVDPSRNLLFEMWRADINPSTNVFNGGCLAVWKTNINPPMSGRGEMCTSADAAGYPITPLLVTADEVYDAVYNNKPINHALRFILPNDRIRYGWYLHPATHTSGGALSGDVDMPPYGTLLRLRADYPVNSLSTPAARAVARAMQKYGMYLSDGGDIALTFQSDRHTTHKWSELNFDTRSMVGITPGDFQMVDGGSRYKDTQNCTRTQLTSLP